MSPVAHLSPWDGSPLISCLFFPERRTAEVVMMMLAAVVAREGRLYKGCVRVHTCKKRKQKKEKDQLWRLYKRFKCARDFCVYFTYMKTKDELGHYPLRCLFPSRYFAAQYTPIKKQNCIIDRMHYVVAQHKSRLFLAFPVLRDTPSCPNIFDLLINFFPTFKYHNTCTSTLLNGQCFWRLYSSVQIPHLSYSTTEIIFIISSHTSLKGIWKSFSTSQIYKAVSSFYCQVPLGLVLDLKGTDVCLQSVKHPGLGRSRTISKGVLNIFPLCCQNVLQINCCPAIVSVFFSFLQCSNFYAFFFFSYFGALCLPSPLLFSSTDFPPSLISLLSFKPANLFLPFAHIKSLIALVTSWEDHSKQRQVLSFS